MKQSRPAVMEDGDLVLSPYSLIPEENQVWLIKANKVQVEGLIFERWRISLPMPDLAGLIVNTVLVIAF